MEIKNWKLKKIIDEIVIISNDSLGFKTRALEELAIPITDNLTGLDRNETIIDWHKISAYYSFFFDTTSMEKKLRDYFINSQLFNTKNVIITYHINEPVIKIPTKLFIEDWEDFFQSTKYETLIFSEDYSLIIEISRDYFLHSNFEIVPLHCDFPN